MNAAHEQSLTKNAERIKNMVGGFALQGFVPKTNVIKTPEVLRRNYQGTLPAKADPVHVNKPKRIYTEEEREREIRAQAITHEKKKWSMPLYNKGPAMVPTTQDIEAMKNGELRRRS